MHSLLVLTLAIGVLFSTETWAQEVPRVSDEPIATKRLIDPAFDTITGLLHAGRLAPHMKCDIKVRTRKEDRKFSSGIKLVETLEVEYYPRGIYADTKVKVVFAMGLSTYGSKVTSNQWSGAGEDILIKANDSQQHWLRFTHDGKGNLVSLKLGNQLADYPCLIKD